MLPAVTVTTSASKKLQVLAISFSFSIILLGFYLGFLGTGTQVLRWASGLVCVVLGGIHLIGSGLDDQPRWQIAISAQGQITCHRIESSISTLATDSDLVTLSAGSILHHSVLFLHFKKTNDNNVINLMVLSDALSRNEFRLLSIACHCLLRRAN